MDCNMVIKQELREIKSEPMDDFPDVDITNSCDYDHGIIQNLKNEDSVKYLVHYQFYFI